MNCSRNDVVLLPIPFTDLTTKKVRPGVVVGKTFSDLFLVPISSKLANTDSPIGDWRAAGLNVKARNGCQRTAVRSQRSVRRLRGLVIGGDWLSVTGYQIAEDRRSPSKHSRVWPR
jgi:hypothetical protein